ncbi:phospholipase D family protein [Microbacterium oleivorans]|uniref:phospholipase D family protein n=1 Tax=Microbacterium oleivorans TaxID=273677 RepID=UPI001268BFC6|nr:phospholipase D family protein [Microbacterium oleivorans]
MDLRFVGQPEVGYRNALDFVVTNLDDPHLTDLTIATAWVHSAGVRLLKPALDRFRARGGRSTLICGLSRGGATVEGLQAGLDSFDQVFVAFDPSGRTVHAKMYLLSGPQDAALLVGSQNLSRSGLVMNHEAGLAFTGAATAGVILDAKGYLDRLVADRALARELDHRLLATLVESDQISFAIPTPTEDAPALIANPQLPVFERSTRSFRGASVPRPQAGRTGTHRPGELPTTVAGETVVARWFKLLPRADAQRLIGSNPTNTMTLTRAGHPIDKTTWFRNELFGNESWAPVPQSARHERAAIVFEVDGLGPRFAEEMFVEHNLRHDSMQNNRVTSIRWGSETRELLRNVYDLTGYVVTIEQFADQTFRLSFSQLEIGPFVSLPSGSRL